MESMAMVAIAEGFVDTLLELASEVERDEGRIKHAILDAARRGDHATVERIAERWLRLPIRDVLNEAGTKSHR